MVDEPATITRRDFLVAGLAASVAGSMAPDVSATTTAATHPTTRAAARGHRMRVTPLFGPYGSSAVKYLDRFADCAANALWFHGFNAEAFDACHKHNVKACVEFKTFRADFNQRPELVPIGIDGKPIRFGRLVQGVCLSKQAFLAETEQHLVEGLRTFAPAGIWFDYLTYAGWFETPTPDLQESCFCADCVADFCRTTNVDAIDPKEILARYQQQWTRHKCQRIAGLAKHYVSLIRKTLPGCIIGAYMCPWTPDEFDGALTRIFAQNYELLAQHIDVFTPLIYCAKSGRTPDWGKQFLTGVDAFIPHDRKVLLILDMLDFPASVVATASSPKPSWGLQLFGGAALFDDPSAMKTFAKAVETIRKAIAKTEHAA
ncbi:MAG: hypothetical protein J7M14_05905 [Planctomycetes bacterium]|nr:hypothetical protein [Planctomycetota bacterium]